MKLSLVLSVLLILLCPTSGKGEEKSQNAVAEKWLTLMKEMLPKAFCKEKSFFRECFAITEPECQSQTVKSYDVCLPSMKGDILKKMGAEGTKNLQAEGAYWGTKLGECMGNDFEKTLIKKRSNNPKCNDAKYWTGKQ